ncbi:MAG: hypothetical protein JMN27_12360 [gamma proteobacterium endosymbiont of Lamellibrachia anaximandri]|nr:hypothetical protein [gamma proteobacterium endosymbiont of Lamellibrachia anaximandri]MBL3534612.1 hypothetical protein [gamma proteobacterium endosymbiont of Lamellibrachia anaximandri]
MTLFKRLQHLLEERQANRIRERADAERVAKAIESIVEGTNPKLRGVSSYQKLLQNFVHNLLRRIDDLVSPLPQAITVNQHSFNENDLINALFSNSEQVQQLFSQNRTLHRYFNEKDNLGRTDAFALFFVACKEKTILGTERRGEMLLRDVQQTAVVFSDHQLLAPEPTEEAVRTTLQWTLLENVTKYVKEQISHLKHALSEEEKQAAALNPEQNPNNPEVYLKALIEQLQHPDELIRMHTTSLRISRMGIKLPLDSTAEANQVTLFETAIGSGQPKAVVIVHFIRDEMG